MDRYASNGSFVGNTLHASWTLAVDQIQFEYVSDLAFTPIPPTRMIRAFTLSGLPLKGD